MLALDQRLRTALLDAKLSSSLLNDLHQQILVTHDPNLQLPLLSKYLAIATSRSHSTMKESLRRVDAMTAFISYVSEMADSVARRAILNIKA